MGISGNTSSGDIQEMPITASIISVTTRWVFQAQKMQTRRYYRPEGAAFLTASATDVGEAYWNHVKTTWRAIWSTGAQDGFRSVLVEEVGGGSAFGEYAIPVGEQSGTRGAGVSGDLMPSFVNVGVRFTVGTRVTRPGQMRIPFLYESDVNATMVGGGFLALVNAFADVMANAMTLGAPVALGVLHPIVVKLEGDPPNVTASQDITGFVTNPYVTSQVSRKVGRGE